MAMFHARKIRFMAGAAALGFLTAAGTLLAAEPATAPNVQYTATGTFASPAVKGNDLFQLAGQTFTVNVVANEALKPTKFTKKSAEYDNLAVSGTFNSGLLPGQPQMIPPGTLANISLQVTTKADAVQFTFPINVLGLPITFSGRILMPAGTISNPAIRPFTAPVTITPASAAISYSCSSACPPPYTGAATTLAVGSGTLSTTLQ